jgi:integrase
MGLFETRTTRPFVTNGSVIPLDICVLLRLSRLRALALFNLAIDSKLRGCDLVRLKVIDLVSNDRVRERVSVIQSKTNRPVQFEVSENTRDSLWDWICSPEMLGCSFLFPSRFHDRPHVSTRQYRRLVRNWVSAIGLGYRTSRTFWTPKYLIE